MAGLKGESGGARPGSGRKRITDEKKKLDEPEHVHLRTCEEGMSLGSSRCILVLRIVDIG